LAKALEKEQALRVSSSDRDEQLERLAYLKSKKTQLLESLESFKDRDPATLEKRRGFVKVAKDAANRWTGMFFCRYEELIQ
jgi:hypothetical protein